MGFNAPEIRLSTCEYEKELGLAAKAKLQSIILQSKDVRLDFERKKDGSLKRDKYGRLLAVFYADGRDVADIMTNARLAEYYDGTGRRRNGVTLEHLFSTALSIHEVQERLSCFAASDVFDNHGRAHSGRVAAAIWGDGHFIMGPIGMIFGQRFGAEHQVACAI